jgi:Ser-tRNA(Ala) deacylase AlaX
MQQSHLYLRDTYLTSHTARIIAVGEEPDRRWVAMDENIFHPQGGGQPADEGSVEGRPVKPRLLREAGLVVLDLQAGEGFAGQVGASLSCSVDRQNRELLAALHTAGHLIDGLMTAMGFTLNRNNHFPGESRIEFDLRGSADPDAVALELQQRVSQALKTSAAVWQEESQGDRAIHIDGFHQAPCGGTHVRTLDDLESLDVVSVRARKGTLRVRYDATHRVIGGLSA